MPRLINPDERADDRDEIDDLYEEHGEPVGLAALRRVVSRAIDDIVKRWLSRDEAEVVALTHEASP